MFWSRDLLGATGPLAKVWQSANQEKRVTKAQVIQYNLQDSVNQILRPSNDAPFALRVSGHLLLGVARLYSRKARYLLDDANEARLKISMAFRTSGNHEIPADMQIENREALMLPDRITALDLELAPMPDFSLDMLSSQMDDVTATPHGRRGRTSNRDINLQEEYNNSQLLQGTPADDEDFALVDDLDLDLDFGVIEMGLEGQSKKDKSMEMGRDAPVERSIEDDTMFGDMDMDMDLDMAGPSKARRARDQSLGLDLDFGDGVQIVDPEGDIRMGEDGFRLPEEASVGPVGPAVPELPDMRRARISESPLSDIDEEFAREVEMEFSRNMTDMYEPVDDPTASTVVARQRGSKKRKLLQPDDQTTLSNVAIKEQQAERHNILKPTIFLPSNARLQDLLAAQKTGAWVASIMLANRTHTAEAPELTGLISVTAVLGPSQLKRKRDSGIADVADDEEQGASKSPRLDFGEDEFSVAMAPSALADQSAVAGSGTILNMADDDEFRIVQDDDETVMPGPAFDETMAPIVHPADSGPISVGTKHAVHILRELFGPAAEHSADVRKKNAVVFQELLPEGRTTKADATKMFFECLVLATKDAIKVEQPEDRLGGPIRVRAKRGLWGAWAEREAGGEIAHQGDDEHEDNESSSRQNQPLQQRGNEPEPAVATSATVTVSA